MLTPIRLNLIRKMMFKKYMLTLVEIFFLFLYSTNALTNQSDNNNKHFVIVTTSYKNARWYKKNLDSVFSQTYKNWHMIYTDDCSPDSTGDLVEEYLKTHDINKQVTLIKNQERKLALHNIVHSIYQCKSSDIIVSLDGDDWFAHPNVLSHLNSVYQNINTWMTFGSFSLASQEGVRDEWLHDYDQATISKRAFREYPNMLPSHLRTFYVGLFKKIQLNDLMYKGEYFDMAWDMAFMIPMIEMASNHYSFINDILYVYNNLNDLNDNKVNAARQGYLDRVIRKLPKYPVLEQQPF